VLYAPFTLNPGLQGLLEFVGGLRLALGFFTRTVAFVLAGNMAVAYFMVHAPRGFFPLLNGGELAIVYCFVFLYFWLAGGANGALIDCAHPPRFPPYRLAALETASYWFLGMARNVDRCDEKGQRVTANLVVDTLPLSHFGISLNCGANPQRRLR
jgi:hypothetical protein